MNEFEQAQDDAEELGDKSSGAAAYIQDDTIATSEFTIVGRIVPQSFAVSSLYGPLTIKLTDIRGVDTDREGGGVVTHLPVESFRTDPPMVWTRPPLDLVLHDAQERSLVEAGLIPLSALPFSPDAAFAAVTSLQRPRRYMGATGEVADANARISARINAIIDCTRSWLFFQPW